MSDLILQIEPLGFPWKTKDPFLFCVHHEDFYPAGNKDLGIDKEKLKGRNIGNDFTIKDGWRMYHGDSVPGFPQHPHRGFETVTVNKSGFVDHSDSLGAIGRFGPGDTQWMTAGKGIQHAEMFPLLNADGDNRLEIFQIWLNLPKANKFVDPYFKMLWKEQTPVVNIKDKKGNTTKIDIIAGEINGVKAPMPNPDSWAANPENEVSILTFQLDPNATFILPADVQKEYAHCSLYFYKGKAIELEGKTIPVNNQIEIDRKDKITIVNSEKTAFILLLQGKPIQEPVAQYGPFVMNTQAEIRQAYTDFQETEFGGWPWPSADPVHDKQVGRFAKHAKGNTEKP